MDNDQWAELQGYCPVGYQAAGQALLGKPEHASRYQGKLYHFASVEAQAMFEKNPDKYVPAFGGYCAFGMSIDKELVPCPRNFKVIDGQLYLFVKNEDTDALQLWNREEPKCMVNAEKHWASMLIETRL